MPTLHNRMSDDQQSGSSFGLQKMTRPIAANDNNPLYLSEAAIAHRVLGANAGARWQGLAAVWEREGLPRIDPMTGCRYWPAVRAFLDRRHGIGSVSPHSSVDGVENWS